MLLNYGLALSILDIKQAGTQPNPLNISRQHSRLSLPHVVDGNFETGRTAVDGQYAKVLFATLITHHASLDLRSEGAGNNPSY